MKTTYKLITVSALALAIVFPAMVHADDGNISIDVDTSVNANTSVNMSGEQLPPPTPAQPGPNGRPSIRAAIRADINSRVENAQNNQDVRNMLERRIGTSTMTRPLMTGDDQGDQEENDDNGSDTPRFRPEMRMRPMMASTSMMMGSTTLRARLMKYEDNGHSMQLIGFEIRKRMVTKEFDVAISNLNNISSRLGSRIGKEAAAGRDMSAASSSLVTANTKIQVASDAVTALEAYLPNASSTVTASTTVNVDTARNLVSTAQQDIKDAQKALNDVVTTIAHAMGLKLGDDRDDSESSSTVSQ